MREHGAGTIGPSTAWRDVKGFEQDVIARLGKLTDLVVIAQPTEASSSLSLMSLETALLESSRAVMMVPSVASADIFHRPIIAWDGSPAAARAVGYAMPLLARVDGCVVVYCASGHGHRADVEDLLRYLSWHGIAGEPALADDLSRPVGESLLAQAGVSRAGLVVMGAYSHGHFRQFVFGGITRHVIQHAVVPVLMAH